MTISLASRPPRRYAALLLLLLPLLAGCSAAANGAHASGSAAKPSASSSSGSAASATLPPCDYLSAADASAIYGVTLTAAETGGACSYSGGADGFGTTVTGGMTGAGDPVWKNEVSSLGKATKLSGVGDEAYGATGSIEVKIVVLSGHTIIEVADADDSNTTTFPKSVAIAKAIIAKLG